MKSLSKLKLFIFSLLIFSIIQQTSGNLIDTVICENNTEQRYAIFLPNDYSENAVFPTIFFFEPGARATLPLKKYKHLANKYNILLACSWNARNGPVINNENAADAMISDVYLNYSVDTSKILLSGFSGGARFCYHYAQKNKFIKGVIACGAGLDDYSKKFVAPNFNYTALIGTRDFNFYEIYQLKQTFIKKKITLPVFVFPGDHMWPDTNSFDKALYVHFSEIAPESINKFGAFQQLEAFAMNDAKKHNDLVLLSWSYENIATFSNNEAIQLAYTDSLNNLIRSKAFKACNRNFRNALIKEDSLGIEIRKATYAIYLTTFNQYTNHKPLSWWKIRIKKFKKFTASKDLYERMLGDKLLSLIEAQMWDSYNQLKAEEFYTAALECSEILLLVDNNAWNWTLKAQMLSKLKKETDVIEIIEDLKQNYPEHINYLQKEKILLEYINQ